MLTNIRGSLVKEIRNAKILFSPLSEPLSHYTGTIVLPCVRSVKTQSIVRGKCPIEAKSL